MTMISKLFFMILFFSILGVFTPHDLYAQGRNAPQAPMPVIVQEAKKEKIFDKIEALGNLRANESVALSALVTEKVTAVAFDDGQRVKAGDILVEMTSAEESALLKEEKSRVDESLRQLERLKPLIEQGAASRATLDAQQRDYQSAKARLEAIRSQMADRIIAAPFDGVIGLRDVSVGTLLQPGMLIATLDDDSVMKLDFDVPSVFLTAIGEGLPIKATSRAFPGRYFEGTVSSIDNQVNPVTRAIRVRALIPNPERELRPGLLMVVELFKNERMSVTVPEEALVMDGEKSFVFTADDVEGKTVAVRREVVTGARHPGRVEIVRGLQEGQKVISHGIIKISDGQEIRIMAAQEPGQDVGEILSAPVPGEKQTGEN